MKLTSMKTITEKVYQNADIVVDGRKLSKRQLLDALNICSMVVVQDSGALVTFLANGKSIEREWNKAHSTIREAIDAGSADASQLSVESGARDLESTT